MMIPKKQRRHPQVPPDAIVPINFFSCWFRKKSGHIYVDCSPHYGHKAKLMFFQRLPFKFATNVGCHHSLGNFGYILFDVIVTHKHDMEWQVIQLGNEMLHRQPRDDY